MTIQRTVARKISSFVTPTDEDLASLDQLTPDERRETLRAEIEKGFSGDLSDRRLDEIIADARRKAAARRISNG